MLQKYKVYDYKTDEVVELDGIEFKLSSAKQDTILPNWAMRGFGELGIFFYSEVKDKDGNEIFESDIIQDDNYNRYIVCFGTYVVDGESKVNHGFYLSNIDKEEIDYLLLDKEYKVVGFWHKFEGEKYNDRQH